MHSSRDGSNEAGVWMDELVQSIDHFVNPGMTGGQMEGDKDGWVG